MHSFLYGQRLSASRHSLVEGQASHSIQGCEPVAMQLDPRRKYFVQGWSLKGLCAVPLYLNKSDVDG